MEGNRPLGRSPPIWLRKQDNELQIKSLRPNNKLLGGVEDGNQHGPSLHKKPKQCPRGKIVCAEPKANWKRDKMLGLEPIE